MKLQPYPRYKPSGVEWLGNVPEHWETKKVTYGFSRIGSGTTPKSDSDEFYDGDVPWVTTSELRETVITKTKECVTRSALVAHSALRLYPTGTLLFAMYGATIGRLGILGIPATLNQACCAFAAPTLFDTRFVFYWLWMRRPILISLSTGGGQPNLSQDDLRQIRISTPPLPEQRAIAAFLDRETGRVDRLVAKKRELIERLKEKRSALISRAVTRGLLPGAVKKYPQIKKIYADELAKASENLRQSASICGSLPENPPVKPSGLDWLGDIPKHWEVLPIKHLLNAILDTEHKTCPFYEDGDFLVARTPNIRDGKLLIEGAKYTDADGYREWTARGKPKPGDILFTREAPAGEACIVPSEPPLCIGQRVVLFRTDPRRVDSRFAIYSIYGGAARVFIEMQSLGSTVTHFNMSEIAMIPMLVPPLPEQAAIAAYLDEETAKLDALVEKVEEAVERLQEYRTALITAAVTGKIDVRKAVAQ